MRQSEITTLRDQLEHVRREKHEVEEERAANAKQRDKEVNIGGKISLRRYLILLGVPPPQVGLSQEFFYLLNFAAHFRLKD